MERWVLLRKGADFEAISKKFHISPRLASLIRNRDVIGDEAINQYLNGTIAELLRWNADEGYATGGGNSD